MIPETRKAVAMLALPRLTGSVQMHPSAAVLASRLPTLA